MNIYFVMITDEVDLADLLKVQADNEEQAKIKALARWNMVDDDEIDLDCTGDLELYVVEESEVEDFTASPGFVD